MDGGGQARLDDSNLIRSNRGGLRRDTRQKENVLPNTTAVKNYTQALPCY